MVVKYRIVFLHKINNKLNVVMVKTLKNPLKNIIKIADRDFAIDFNNVCYSNSKYLIYFMDIDTTSQYSFNEVKGVVDARTLDLIVSQKIIKELSQSISENPASKFLLIMLGIMGFLAGFIVGSLVTEQKYIEPADNPYEEITTMIQIVRLAKCLIL